MVALATGPDLLRLLTVPGFAWAAYRDLRTRRVPNRLWLPLAAIGLTALAWEVGNTGSLTTPTGRLLLLRIGVAVGFLIPFAYIAYRVGAFGGADAKALMTLALCFPTYPTFYLPSTAFPLVRTTLGVFAMTALTNAVVLGAGYVVALGGRNLLAGRLTLAGFIGRPVPVSAVPRTHGSLLRTESTVPSRGLDLDALRMYLRWRGTTLDALREAPEQYRDPSSVTTTHPPTDGAVAVGDGGADQVDGAAAPPSDAVESRSVPGASSADLGETYDDPWAAERFLDEIDTSAYGTTPEVLREGLERLTHRDTVWVSPGLPFLVPLFGGLLIGFLYGDVLFVVLEAVGLA